MPTYRRLALTKCPECGETLTYERGFPGSYWEPPEPEQLYCEGCEWEADSGNIDDYMTDNER